MRLLLGLTENWEQLLLLLLYSNTFFAFRSVAYYQDGVLFVSKPFLSPSYPGKFVFPQAFGVHYLLQYDYGTVEYDEAVSFTNAETCIISRKLTDFSSQKLHYIA